MKNLKLLLLSLVFAVLFISCDDSASSVDANREGNAVIDTVYVRDTISQVDSVYVRDTISRVDSVYVRDTLKFRDTLRIHESAAKPDSLKSVDSVTHKDTIKISDTVKVHDTVTVYKDALPICEGRAYNPQTETCIEDKIYDLCGDKPYDKNQQICDSAHAVVYGVFMDSRDKKRYRTITIGEQTWMAENLNFSASRSVCGGAVYEDAYLKQLVSAADCNVYGRLYAWASAMGLDAEYDSLAANKIIKKPHRGICPEGWHIPDNEEWHALFDAVTSRNTVLGFDEQMKSDSLWSSTYSKPDYVISNPGLNTTGFNALPAGRAAIKNGETVYYEGSYDAFFLSADDFDYGARFEKVTFYNYMSFYNREFNGKPYVLPYAGNGIDKKYFASLRCLKDNP